MTYQTVHIDGSGELRSMDLDAWQSTGRLCAFCGTDSGTSDSSLEQFGKLVGPGTPIMVCRSCTEAGRS